jgi:hypothetical protein
MIGREDERQLEADRGGNAVKSRLGVRNGKKKEKELTKN